MELFSLKPPRSHLLDLPAELREHIFSLAVTSEKPIVTFRLDKFQKESYTQAFQPAITKVSRQVRREALPLYYDCNEFIIHTEGQKAEDAHRWLYYSQPHLPKLCRLALWMRYVTLTNDHSPSSGAIGVYLRHDPRADCWVVSDSWRWITVVRKPSGVEWDGMLLIQFLTQLVDGRSRTKLTAEDYVGIMSDLKMLYIKDKMNSVG
jgi:hypothetical protein